MEKLIIFKSDKILLWKCERIDHGDMSRRSSGKYPYLHSKLLFPLLPSGRDKILIKTEGDLASPVCFHWDLKLEKYVWNRKSSFVACRVWLLLLARRSNAATVFMSAFEYQNYYFRHGETFSIPKTHSTAERKGSLIALIWITNRNLSFGKYSGGRLLLHKVLSQSCWTFPKSTLAGKKQYSILH